MKIWATISIAIAVILFLIMMIIMPGIRGLSDNRSGFNLLLGIYFFYAILVLVNGVLLRKALKK